ncbi:hypothetical protein DFH08DRAFT_797260 [Mycena albidolilacea]|uniref:Uncharacterized protein n=1 Tax=Mycena albidolilacea TaxID=1033008 RepID=A0AAD7F537_9AGAR|nr:hypothetical protein DFH08DRAFT_797260 [Mycena albidolilacea]
MAFLTNSALKSLPPAWRRPFFAFLGGICVLIIFSLNLIHNRLAQVPTSFTNAHPSVPEFSDSLRLVTVDLDSWMPLSFSTCLFGMPAYYAPCAAQKLENVEYAEELVYPDFQIRKPYFAQEEHHTKWCTFTQTAGDFDQASLHLGWMQYKG